MNEVTVHVVLAAKFPICGLPGSYNISGEGTLAFNAVSISITAVARSVLVTVPDECYLWQSGECWTIQNLWRWMSSFGRLDLIVLALMLVCLFAIVIHVYCRYHLARRRIDNASRRTLASAL